MKKNTSECCAALRDNLPLDKRRVELLAALLIALLQYNTSNLARLAHVLDLDAKQESKYKRLQRFLRHAPLTDEMLAPLLLALIKPKGKYILALDRTEWKYGAVWVNILTLSLVCGNTAIPLLWQTLNRKGNSTLAEKKALLGRYKRLFGVEEIDYLCADREFDGYQWVQYLKQEGFPFRLRVKVSMKLTDKRGKLMPCGKLLRTLKIGERYALRRGRRYGGVEVFVEAQRGRDSKESMIVLSSEPSGKILPEYKRRWAIETLLQNLKGRGFELEETHLREAARVDKLFGILALGVAWAVQTGAAESLVKPLVLKKNGRPQQSLFRLGNDVLQEVLLEIKRSSRVNVFEILRC